MRTRTAPWKEVTSLLVALAAEFVLLAPAVHGQQVELSAAVGRTASISNQFERSLPIPQSASTIEYRIKNTAGNVVGVGAVLLVAPLFGVEVAGSYQCTDRRLDIEVPAWLMTDADARPPSAASVTTGVLRLQRRRRLGPHTEVRVAAGIAVLHFGGRGYDPENIITGLRNNTVLGGSVGLRLGGEISRRVFASAGIDDLFYRVSPGTDFVNERKQVLMQHDLGVTVAFGWRP